MRSRIGFSPARQCNLVMSDTIRDWIGISKRLHEPPEDLVLRVFERDVIAALELDTDRKVVASLSAMPL